MVSAIDSQQATRSLFDLIREAEKNPDGTFMVCSVEHIKALIAVGATARDFNVEIDGKYLHAVEYRKRIYLASTSEINFELPGLVNDHRPVKEYTHI